MTILAPRMVDFGGEVFSDSTQRHFSGVGVRTRSGSVEASQLHLLSAAPQSQFPFGVDAARSVWSAE